MKRFYKTVAINAVGSGHALLLDDRKVLTPARAPLVLPNAVMAEALAAEWAEQGEQIILSAMPLNGLANAAIDQIAGNRSRFVSDIAAYGETDTLCYRADAGDPLALRQQAEWDPILHWAEKRFDMALIRVAGIIHQPQSHHSLSRMKAVVDSCDPFVLAGLSTITSIGGSLVAALGLLENAFETDMIWQALCLEECWQEELWGADADAVKTREHRRTAFDAACRFCCIAQGKSPER